MDLSEYQKLAKITAIYPKDEGVPYCLMGIGEESGEVLGKYKKFLRGDYDEAAFKEYVLAEMGDLLWYLAMLSEELGYDLNTVAQNNLAKLRSRKEREVLKGNGDER